MLPAVQQQQWAAPDDWESHKEVIANLYWDQGKTLKEVMQVMREKHDFYATDRMYKSRLKKWGLTKYLKADQVAQARRQAARGRITVPLIRGRLAGPKRLKQQLSRKLPEEFAMLLSSADAAAAAGSAAVVIARRGSQTPSPLSTCMDSPGQFKILEGCLRSVMDYTQGKMQGNGWNPLADYQSEDESEAWHNRVLLSRAMIERGKMKDGFRLLDICLKNYTQLIDKEHPLLMIETYQSIMTLSQVKFDLAESVLGYIAGLCKIRLGPTHPYTRLWSGLRSAGMGQTRQIAAVILKAQLGMFSDFFDPTAEFMLIQNVDSARQLHCFGNLSIADAEANIMKSIRQREVKALPDTMDFVCWAKEMLAFIYKFNGKFDKAGAILDEVAPYMDSPSSGVTLFTVNEYYNIRCQLTAEIESATYEEIKTAFQNRLEFCLKNVGLDHPFTSRAIAELDWQYGQENDIEASNKLHEEFDFESSWDNICKIVDTQKSVVCSEGSPQSSSMSTGPSTTVFTPTSSADSSGG